MPLFKVGSVNKEKKVKSYDEAVEEKEERLDDTGDGGDTCFLKKSYARAGGQEEFSNQSPARLRERFFKKMLSSVSPCHSGTSRLSTISILLRPRKQVT